MMTGSLRGSDRWIRIPSQAGPVAGSAREVTRDRDVTRAALAAAEADAATDALPPGVSRVRCGTGVL
jgi:hypothetical protein